MNKETLLEIMRDFGIPFMNISGELILDVKRNLYCSTEGLETRGQIEASIVMSMTRPIYKVLPDKQANIWLARINEIYGTLLTKDDMGEMYRHLCYWRKLPEMERFIADRFPMAAIEEYAKDGE